MFKKFTLAAVAAAAAVTAIPAAAEARPRGYYDQGYNRGYDNGYYEQRRYNRGYNNRGYYGRHAYRGRSCAPWYRVPRAADRSRRATRIRSAAGQSESASPNR